MLFYVSLKIDSGNLEPSYFGVSHCNDESVVGSETSF